MRARKIRIFAGVTGAAVFLTAAVWAYPDLTWSLSFQMGKGRSGLTPSVEKLEPLPKCPGCHVVLVSMDTLRADRLGFMGCATCRTPNMDRIAGESLYFTRAYSNATFTTPSHMTLFTSLYPSTHLVESHSIRWTVGEPEMSGPNPHSLDRRFVTLAEVLAKSGYDTYWFGPQKLKFFSMADGFGRGFRHLAETPFRRGISFGAYNAENFDKSALGALASKNRSFLFLHGYITHSPFFLGREDKAKFGSDLIPYWEDVLGLFVDRLELEPRLLLSQLDTALTDAEAGVLIKRCVNLGDPWTCFRSAGLDSFWHAVGHLHRHFAYETITQDLRGRAARSAVDVYRRSYDHTVEQLDTQIGQLWDELKRMGVLEKSIVVLFSDHGEELFDHGSVNHTQFYEHTARVPLIIHVPGVRPAVSSKLVSLVDVMPTVLEMVGIEPPKQTQGHALWNLDSAYVFGYTMSKNFVMDGEWKLIRQHTGKEELYYLPLDAGEKNNLVQLYNPWSRAAYARLVEARKTWETSQALD